MVNPPWKTHHDDALPATGPNASGKTCYAKSVAHAVFLAHLGCFIPAAEGSTIGLTDRIATRLLTHDSLAGQASSFMVDLGQASGWCGCAHVLIY